jgi:hypothetical protein
MLHKAHLRRESCCRHAATAAEAARRSSSSSGTQQHAELSVRDGNDRKQQRYCYCSRLTAAEQVLSRQCDATLKATTIAECAVLFGGLRCRSAAEGRRVAYVSQHSFHITKLCSVSQQCMISTMHMLSEQ